MVDADMISRIHQMFCEAQERLLSKIESTTKDLKKDLSGLRDDVRSTTINYSIQPNETLIKCVDDSDRQKLNIDTSSSVHPMTCGEILPVCRTTFFSTLRCQANDWICTTIGEVPRVVLKFAFETALDLYHRKLAPGEIVYINKNSTINIRWIEEVTSLPKVRWKLDVSPA